MTAAAGSVRDALGAAVDALAAAGVDSPRLDAELLLAEASGCDRTALIADGRAEVSAAVGRAFGAMVRRRLEREPVAYIVGRRWFRNIELAVDRRVLVPRPETELLVELALELRPRRPARRRNGLRRGRARGRRRAAGLRGARHRHLGRGSGGGGRQCPAAGPLRPREPRPRDASRGGLRARPPARQPPLRRRARLAGAGARGQPLGAPRGAARRPGRPRRLPRPHLQLRRRNSFRHPERSAASPREGGRGAAVVGLEVGEGQAAEVARLLAGAGFAEMETRRDLAGIERVVVARR